MNTPTQTLLIDAFGRVKETVHRATTGLSQEQLATQPEPQANSIAWLVWHLTRVQDDHIAELAHQPQLWATTWHKQFKLPFDQKATGYGHTSKEVAAVKASASLLLAYYDAVHEQTTAYIQTLTDKDFARVIDTNWDPPVTLGVRLISVLDDDLQHAGQAAYIRGLLKF